MRVLHITPEFPPHVCGGIGTYVDAVTSELIARNHDVEVLLVKGDNSYYDHRGGSIPSINVTEVAFGESNFTEIASGILQPSSIQPLAEVNLCRSPDVIHIHDWYGVLHALQISDIDDVPSVITSHLPLRSGFSYGGHPFSLRRRMQVESLGFRVASKILTPSQFTSTTVQTEYSIADSKIEIIPNGVDTEQYKPSSDPENANKKMILAVARLTPQKGIEHLIHAAKMVIGTTEASVEFVIVGEGPEHDRLRSLSETLGVNDSIRFEGAVKEKILQQLYSKADIFVLPSVYEPFGLVMLEAMSSATPVVAFDTGGVGEILRDEKDGLLVAPGRDDALAASIQSLVADNETRRQMGTAARKRAEGLTWKSHVNKVVDVYQQSINA